MQSQNTCIALYQCYYGTVQHTRRGREHIGTAYKGGEDALMINRLKLMLVVVRKTQSHCISHAAIPDVKKLTRVAQQAYLADPYG